MDVPVAAAPDGNLRRFQSDLRRCQRTLDEYLDLLIRWQRDYAPRSSDDEPDDRYVEACRMLEPIDYMASLLSAGSLEQSARSVERLLADGTLDRLEARLKKLSEEERSSAWILD